MSDDVSMIDEGNYETRQRNGRCVNGNFKLLNSRVARLRREIDSSWERVNRKRMKFYLRSLSFRLMMVEILSTASSYNCVDAYSTFPRVYDKSSLESMKNRIFSNKET